MNNKADIIMQLHSINEYELTDLERERMQRIVVSNKEEFEWQIGWLQALGHRHLARSLQDMLSEYTKVEDENEES